MILHSTNDHFNFGLSYKTQQVIELESFGKHRVMNIKTLDSKTISGVILQKSSKTKQNQNLFKTFFKSETSMILQENIGLHSFDALKLIAKVNLNTFM